MADKLPIATERSMLLRTNTDESGEHPFLIEVAPNLSAMNSRLYRQSRLYNVRFEAAQNAGGTSIGYEFYTLPDTWFVRGAIKYAHKTYMQNHADELANGVKFSKWHDFRVSPQNPDGTYEFTAGRMFDGDGYANLVQDEPSGAGGTYSTTKAADGTSMGFHVIGNVANSYNILREYAELINNRKPDSEEITAVQPYGELLDLKDAEQMVESGDRAPYDRDFSSMIPDDETVDDATGQHILTLKSFLSIDRDSTAAHRTPYFTAPLGLVYVRRFSNGTLTDLAIDQQQLRMEVQAGKYKGVKAPSLVEPLNKVVNPGFITRLAKK